MTLENTMIEKPSPILSLRNITKLYGSFCANDGVDLDVEKASIHALLGENGAGKSTLMKIAYGVSMLDEGDIFWQGERVDLRNTAQARKLGIGMVFQHFSLFETLSVVENIAMTVPGRKKDLAKKVQQLGEDYNLLVDPYASVHSLSVGERQRVEIIRCLMQDLKLLILDEPTSVLPPQHVAVLFNALRKLQENGVAILYISHKLEEIRELCDTATILRAGKVTGSVDPRKKTASELATLMIGRDIPKINARHVHTDGREPQLRLSNVNIKNPDPFGTDLKIEELDVFRGEIVGIAGISGNGQKELGRIISGEDISTQLGAEAIEMFGRSVAHLNAIDRRKHGFCFVPEERLGRGAVPPLPLWANALLTAHQKDMLKLGFINHRALDSFAEKCIKDFDVRCSGKNALASSLSGGNLQKYIIGREMMLEPQLLFVSQPTWGVDIGAATDIRRKLLALRDEGVAILVISEELDELFEICDRLYVINHGSLSSSLDPASVSPNDIGEIMIGANFAPRGENDAA